MVLSSADADRQRTRSWPHTSDRHSDLTNKEKKCKFDKAPPFPAEQEPQLGGTGLPAPSPWRATGEPRRVSGSALFPESRTLGPE